MKLLFVYTLLITAIIIFLVACKKELSCENCNSNKLPIAIAGDDQTLSLPKDSTFLDGTASTDSDGTITSYYWAKISGPSSSTIFNKNTSKTELKNLVQGVYEFELTVTDNLGLSSKDTVHITVNNPGVNQPPIAHAGPDQTIMLPIDNASLNGSLSIDPDGRIVKYQWSKISGPSVFIITNPQLVQTKVNNLVEGIYQFELKVTDNGGLTSTDTLSVIVQRSPETGIEVIFDDLIWEQGDFYGLGLNDVYVGTPAKPDIFINSPGLAYSPSLKGEVYFKFDSTSNWIQAFPAPTFQQNPSLLYVYDIISPSLYIHVYPLSLKLVGTKGSIKVKFY